MERRVLIAICLCFAVLYLWQTLVPPPAPRSKPEQSAAPSSMAPAGTEPSAAAPAPPPPPSATPLVSDAAEREVRVETRTVIAVFTNRGGRLKSWRLKQYLDERREPLELVATDLPDQHALPFSLKTTDRALDAVLNNSLYTIRSEPAVSDPISAATTLMFEYRDSAGVRSFKEFRLEPNSYELTFRADVTNQDAAVRTAVEWGPAIGSGGASASSGVQAAEGILFVDGDVERLSP
jgi:YidC/Oxa1 family membrane protein insertase